MTRRLDLAQGLAALAMTIAGCADDHGLTLGDAATEPNDAFIHSIVRVPDAASQPDAVVAIDAGSASTCSVANATETRMPRFLHEGQPFAATIHAISGECGCTAAIPPILFSHSLRMELCSCCQACDCVGGSYEASIDSVSLPVGSTTLSIPHGSASVVVVPATTVEHSVVVTNLRVVGPDHASPGGGPPLWWVEVTGTDALCCATPMPLVDVDPMANHFTSGIALAATSAAQDPCACLGRPMPFTAWHSLGVLPADHYTLTINGVTTTFSTP